MILKHHITENVYMLVIFILVKKAFIKVDLYGMELD